MEFDTGFSKITEILKDDFIQTLTQKCGYTPREIMFFGLGQGAMAALAIAASMPDELGGIVSIGGPLPASDASPKDVETPLLVLGGSSNTW